MISHRIEKSVNYFSRSISLVGLLLCVAGWSPAAAEVTLRALTNGARMAPSSFRYATGLAQGSIFVGYGSELGPNELVHGSIPLPTRLPAEPGGTQVTIRSLETGETFDVPLLHTSATQFAGIIPSRLPIGEAEIFVSYDGEESSSLGLRVVEDDPELFSISQQGSGPGVIQNYESPTAQPLNALTRPATPGQHIILWATGLGAIDGPDNIPPPPGNLRDDIAVRFGEFRVPAEYAGRSPQFSGVDQINVLLPDDPELPRGCYVPVNVEVGGSWGRSSSDVSVAIADDPAQCDHPWELPRSKMQELDEGGTASYFALRLQGTRPLASFERADALGVYERSGATSFPFRSWSGSGGCLPGFFATLGNGVPGPYNPPLEVGPAVARIAAHDLRQVELWKQLGVDRFTSREPVDQKFYVAGEWTLESYGLEGTKPFATRFRVSPLPEVDALTEVSLSSDMAVTWDGSQFAPGDRLSINLKAPVAVPDKPGQVEGNALLCSVDATSGRLDITASEVDYLEVEAGAGLQWQISVEHAAQTFRTDDIDYGEVTIDLTLDKVEAVAVD